MPTAKMSSKGQLTVPKEVRSRLRLATGSRVDFVEDREGYRLVSRKLRVVDLYGVLPKPPRPVTLLEMDAAIAAGAAESMPL